LAPSDRKKKKKRRRRRRKTMHGCKKRSKLSAPLATRGGEDGRRRNDVHDNGALKLEKEDRR